MDLEIVLNKISSPEDLLPALNNLKTIRMKKINCNILKILQNIIRINKKDSQQFYGIVVVYKVLLGCLKHEFTDADWLKLHEEFARSVIIVFECILLYKETNFIKEDSFCIVVLQLSKLVFPIVYKVDSVRSSFVKGGFNVIVSLICLNELDFKIRKEVFPLLKPILVKTNPQERKLIIDSSASLMSSIAKQIIDCGDYETQEGLVEILMRFSCASKQKLNIICIWFQSYINDLNLIKVLDYSNFDLSCREFLNALNSANSSKVKVITLPCLEAYANDLLLKKPNKEKYRELWVDFSIASGNVHLVCDNENVWLKLIISPLNVKKIIASRRVMKGAGAIQFLVELISPLQLTTSSTEKYVASLTLIFLYSPKIVELKEDFFLTCYRDVFEEEKNKLSLMTNSCFKTSEWGKYADTPCAHDCFCDGANSISSIHPASDYHRPNYKRKDGNNFTSFDSSRLQSHSLATSTPKVPSLISHSYESKEKCGFLETSSIKPISDSINSNKKSPTRDNNNNNESMKWQKASLIRYNKNPSVLEEDRKFQQMCENLSSSSAQSKSQSQSIKLNNEKILENKGQQQHQSSFNKITPECPSWKPILTTSNEAESKKGSEEDNLKTFSAESKLSEESPFALTINKTNKTEISANSNKTNKTEIPANSNKKNQQLSLNQYDIEKGKEKDNSSDLSKLQNMKKLFTDKKYHTDRLGLQYSNKPPSTSFPNLKMSPLKKTNNFFLRPPKLHLNKPSYSDIKSNNEFALPLSGHNTNIFGSVKKPSENGSDRTDEKNLTFKKETKNYFSTGNKISHPSENLFISSLGKFDKIINSNDAKCKPVVKKIKVSENDSPNDAKSQNKIISNAPVKDNKYFTEKKLDRTTNKNSGTNQSETCTQFGTPPEVNGNNYSDKIPSILAKKIKIGAICLSKIKETKQRDKSLDIYEWNSSKSATDNEGDLLTSFKYNSNRNNTFFKKPSNENDSLNKMARSNFNSLNSEVLKLDCQELSSKSILDSQKDSLNTSIHCKVPTKTYGLKNTKVNLELTSEKIFENVKMNTASTLHNKNAHLTRMPKKRKLFNPNDNMMGGSLDIEENKDYLDVSNESSPIFENLPTNKITVTHKKKVKQQQSKSNKYKQSEATKCLLSGDDKISEPNRRRSLRLRGQVKYTDPSTESTSSCGTDKFSTTGLNIKKTSKKGSLSSPNEELNKSDGLVPFPDTKDCKNKVEGTLTDEGNHNSGKPSILDEGDVDFCNSNNKTTFTSNNSFHMKSKEIDSVQSEDCLRVKPKIVSKKNRSGEQSKRRNSAPPESSKSDKNILTGFGNMNKKRQKDKNSLSSEDEREPKKRSRKNISSVTKARRSDSKTMNRNFSDEADGMLRNNEVSTVQNGQSSKNPRKDDQNDIGESSLLMECNPDPLREDSNCDLSLQGIPIEVEKSDGSALELVKPTLRLSTDNTEKSSSPGYELQHESSLGTQAEARAELAFLDNVISDLEKMTISNSRKKILTEVVSMDKALKKMELFTNSSNKDLKKIITAMKNSMETLIFSYEDFFAKLATKTTDVISIMSRLSEDVGNDQDFKLNFIQNIEKLCKERRNVVIEEKFI